MNESQRRVVVTSPRMRGGHASARYPLVREIDEQTELGEVYMRSLVRTQLRLGLLAGGVMFVLLASLPVLFAALPALGQVRLFGIPLPWLILGILVYPVLLAGGWAYVRQAERNERDFAEFVEDS